MSVVIVWLLNMVHINNNKLCIYKYFSKLIIEGIVWKIPQQVLNCHDHIQCAKQQDSANTFCIRLWQVHNIFTLFACGCIRDPGRREHHESSEASHHRMVIWNWSCSKKVVNWCSSNSEDSASCCIGAWWQNATRGDPSKLNIFAAEVEIGAGTNRCACNSSSWGMKHKWKKLQTTSTEARWVCCQERTVKSRVHGHC